MPSIRSRLVRTLIVKSYMRSLFDLDRNSIEQMRQKSETSARFIKLPKGSHVEPLTVANRPAEWIRAAHVSDAEKATILYIHSGAFCLEYSTNHREFASRLSQVSGCRVLALDYRLAPEHPYPAANEDCLAAYQWLLAEGIPAEKIVIGGDSAGGGLVLMTLLALRDAGEPRPAAAFLLSPLGGDLVHFDGDSYETRDKTDPLNTRESIQKFAALYWGATPIDERPVPIREELSGLPPLFIQMGDQEVTLSDATRLAERAKAVGVEVDLEVWEDMWHVFQGFAAFVPEAKESIEHIGEFVRCHLGK